MSEALQPAPLGGRIAVVSGATRGIGRTIALRLARAGADLGFAYRQDAAAAASLQDEIRQLGRKVHAMRLDVANHAACATFAAEVRGALGEVDIVINNAGVVADKPLYAMTEGEWDQVLDTNLKGAFNFTQAFLSRMLKRGGGRVINIASVSALRGLAGQTNYAASKAGLLGFTRALAAETARFGVTVNAIAPGYIETEMLTTIPEDKRAKITKSVPMGRLGSEDDVAQAVLYLASEGAAYVTGIVLPVDGGLLL